MSLTEAQLTALFPPGVVVRVATEADADPGVLLEGERELAARMVPRRLAEFAAGRAVARRALAAAGVGAGPLVRVEGQQHVAWPSGVAGSISHAEGIVAAAVAPVGLATRYGVLKGLGLDVEVEAPMAPEMVQRICLPSEIERFQDALDEVMPFWRTLTFAVKEAAYKAWYPVTLEPLDFHDMQVVITVDGLYGAFVRKRGQFDIDAHELFGYWTRGPGHVAASACLTIRPPLGN